VEKNVRYHSSQKTPDRFIATNVSKFTNHKNVVMALDLVGDRVMVEMTEVQEATEQEKCLPRPVVTVEKNVRYHSSQKAIGRFIATNVSKFTNHKNVVVALDLVFESLWLFLCYLFDVGD